MCFAVTVVPIVSVVTVVRVRGEVSSLRSQRKSLQPLRGILGSFRLQVALRGSYFCRCYCWRNISRRDTYSSPPINFRAGPYSRSPPHGSNITRLLRGTSFIDVFEHVVLSSCTLWFIFFTTKSSPFEAEQQEPRSATNWHPFMCGAETVPFQSLPAGAPLVDYTIPPRGGSSIFISDYPGLWTFRPSA